MSEEFFRRSRQIFAGILGVFQENLTQSGGKRPAQTVFEVVNTGSYIVITFGIDHEIQSPRIDVATEAQPNRWTHHILISDPSEIDDELMGWVKEASIFSDAKR